MRYTLRGLPEMELFDSEEQRAEVVREIETEAGRPTNLWYWLAVAILVSATLVTNRIMKWLLARLVVWPEEIEDALQWLVMILMIVVVLRWLHRWGAAVDLRRKLLIRGVPVCLGCGYSLRGHSEAATRCPECGRSFDEAVRRILIDETRNASD